MVVLKEDLRKAYYCQVPDGTYPALDFLRNLSPDDNLRVQDKVQMLDRYGIGLRRPHVDTLRDGIHELRVKIQRNNVEVRLLFFFSTDRIIITHGVFHKSRGTSKHQGIPEAEIDRAVGYRQHYELTHGKG